MWSSLYCLQARYGNRDYQLAVANMCSVYHDKVYWWEAVMLLQRLLLNIITTFATAIPLIRSIMAMTVCLCFLLVHMSLRPLRHPAAEFAQTAFQVSG